MYDALESVAVLSWRLRSHRDIIIIIIISAQGISDTEGEEKMVRKCKRWNDH